MATPLEQLAEASGFDFPNLRKARELTPKKLASRREALGDLDGDEDVAVVLMGSWGRAEVTSGSDDDFMLLRNYPRTPWVWCCRRWRRRYQSSAQASWMRPR